MRDGEATTPNAGRTAERAAIFTLVPLSILLLGAGLGWWPGGTDAESLGLLSTAVLFSALGPLILWKAQGNRVGWVFWAIGVSMLMAGVTGGLADRGLLAFSAIGGAFWLGWIVGIGTLLLWFPTGRVPSRGWLWLQWLGFALIALTFITYAFTEQVCVGEGGEFGCTQWAANPIGIPGMPNPEFGWLAGPLFSFYPFFMAAALVSLIVRYRRSMSVERLQLKWFLLACFSFVLALSAEMVLELFGVLDPPVVLDVWIDLSIVSIPIAATLAILRYRLYEIDRIISRTVSYLIVIALLGTVYALGLAGLTSLLDTESSLAVAASTLAAAALFNPVRKRVQSFVDHRFNRTRYDTELVMAGFTGTLRDEVDPGTVVDGWVSVVSETMRPVAAGVWLRETT